MNKYIRSLVLVLLLQLISGGKVFSQSITIQSPDKRIKAELLCQQQNNTGEWYLKVSYQHNNTAVTAIPRIDLGLIRNDQDFSKQLKFIRAGKPALLKEQYTTVHGKRSVHSNTGNQVVASFENPSKAKLNIIIAAYNDGVVFRYEFPDKQGSFVVKDELTSYSISRETTRWLEKWNPANEGYYTEMKNAQATPGEWCYPALFKSTDSTCWFLLHEADLDETYCGTKLSNMADSSKYKLSFPNPKDGRGQGESTPTINLPWKSPWRVINIGSLSDIVESTLVDDVSPPSRITNTAWIRPGLVSWNYWSDNHGTKDFKTVCEFADLAAAMGWPYTLLDWEWDAMGNGGKLEDAIRYIHAKGVKPLMWYNSGGNHTWVNATPKDRMLTHENRVEEFAKLKKLGVDGIKVDFFESEKQDMIKYYLDIVRDAAQFEIMVYFHGCLVPRGWARTYPNLMTYEAVRGAEWYNNVPDFTNAAPSHNTILPFTRNVVGAMDYTPVTFTNSQHPHITSYGHELALSVLFESGLQHLADRPDGYYSLPDAARTFLRDVPNAWDDIKLLDGYPGQEISMARRKGDNWYVGSINGQNREKKKTIKLDFLQEGVKYKMILIADGKHDKELLPSYRMVQRSDSVDVRLLRRGGFAASFKPVQ
ncbi:glycoside hydrolase family 97 protein [Terrimonas sp. NA20]|uniref:Glycoside hydrolase family 97 protein n=1 Tax=Terrimonas ginsenosidimutans TaxID=2908004 RepID=A0ABS9KVH8_9BACT|nr:glycoside hydrolase family 97 protein [Terrimonas ginsenosidimutans]